MGRYFATMRAIVEAHGGTVEKFIGDAVMAVFGIPQLHEDDALRAVRAAAEIRDALANLNEELENQRGITIRFRTGVTTGEVVVGDPASGTTLVTGDTVNTAARLEQAAAPGEILIGRVTHTLVRDAVDAEPVEPIAAKGKAEPVAAFRLLSVRAGAEGRTRRLETPLVGRERELGRLDQAFRQAVDDRSCQLFTVLGLAGVGKSRLVAEFLDTVGTDATVLRGRCLSYGEGITFWPIRELVHEAAGIVDSDTADEARAKLGGLFGEARDAASLADDACLRARPAGGRGLARRPRVGGPATVRATGSRSARSSSSSRTSTGRSPRCSTCSSTSSTGPATPRCSSSAPPARSCSSDVPAWGGGKLNATTVLLEPLPTTATERLIELLPGGTALSPAMVDRITAAADGNPLYVEELVAMLVDDGVVTQDADGRWVATRSLDEVRVPPSISALLAARLDHLVPTERDVAQRASVIGRVFERSRRQRAEPGWRPRRRPTGAPGPDPQGADPPRAHR